MNCKIVYIGKKFSVKEFSDIYPVRVNISDLGIEACCYVPADKMNYSLGQITNVEIVNNIFKGKNQVKFILR